MAKRIFRIITSCLLSIILLIDLFSVSALAGTNRVYQQIGAIPTRDWVYSSQTCATMHFGAPTCSDEAFVYGPQFLITEVVVLRADYQYNTLFSGGVTDDGDFHVDINGPAGATYLINVFQSDQTTGYSKTTEFTFVSDADNATIEKVGNIYSFINMTMVSINGYDETLGNVRYSFTPGMKRYKPEIYEIVNGTIKCRYLKGTQVQ